MGCFYTQNYFYEHVSIGKIYIPLISLQIQKFAVRFPRLSDAESFLNSVKVQFSILLLSSDSVHMWLSTVMQVSGDNSACHAYQLLSCICVHWDALLCFLANTAVQYSYAQNRKWEAFMTAFYSTVVTPFHFMCLFCM